MSSAPTPARERNPRGEGDKLRVELLDAAAELMAEKGDIDAISLRSIAARAGVSPTAVYRHFDDHLDLLTESVRHCWVEFDRAFDRAEAGIDDPYDDLDAMGRAYIEFALGQPGKYHVLFANKIDLEIDGRSIGLHTFDRLVDKVARILDEQDDERDPWFVAVEVFTWIHGIVDLIGRHGDGEWPPIEVLLDDLQRRLGLVRT
jgi:AcrR family transcriptional regulator